MTTDFNSGRWFVLDHAGTRVEEHRSPKAAYRAAMILSAHEIKNGRVGNYCVEPPEMNMPTFEELDLPEWAYKVLTEAL